MKITALRVLLTVILPFTRAFALSSSNRGTEEEYREDDSRSRRLVDAPPGLRRAGKRREMSHSRLSRSSSKRSSRGKKGKGKGKRGGGANRDCLSAVARNIADSVPEVVTQNPRYCCYDRGPTAVIVTHALTSELTDSGFESLWDTVYFHFLQSSSAFGACFVMAGYDPSESDRSLSDVLIDVNNAASDIITVPAIMTTDPTNGTALMSTIRGISERPNGPSIGVFNAGYANIVIESLISGKDRLQYIGHQNDREYGTQAAGLALELLGKNSAKPLCLNGHPDFRFVGQRCAAFYDSTTTVDVQPRSGIDCSSPVNATELAVTIIRGGVEAIFADTKCCSGAEEAAHIARSRARHEIVVGCMDLDTTGGRVNFVTAQAIDLQSFHTFSFVSFPVVRARKGDNGRAPQFFPALETQVNTGISTTLVLSLP